MNLDSRPPRTHRRFRTLGWIVLICVVFLIANAVITGARKPASSPSATLDFVDQIRPFIDESNSEAAELSAIRAGFARVNGQSGPADTAKSLEQRLRNLDHDASKTKNKALDVNPAKGARDTASLMWASLTLRAQAVSSIDDSL